MAHARALDIECAGRKISYAEGRKITSACAHIAGARYRALMMHAGARYVVPGRKIWCAGGSE